MEFNGTLHIAAQIRGAQTHAQAKVVNVCQQENILK